jgi:hypothetical protein
LLNVDLKGNLSSDQTQFFNFATLDSVSLPSIVVLYYKSKFGQRFAYKQLFRLFRDGFFAKALNAPFPGMHFVLALRNNGQPCQDITALVIVLVSVPAFKR